MCQNKVVNTPNMKFYENISGGSHVVPFRHMGMIRLVVCVCFTNMPSSCCVRVLTQCRQRSLDQGHSITVSPEI